MIDIIPAIDIMNGQCVRLKRGDFLQQTHYGLDLFELVQNYEKQGFKRLHIVDLDAASGDGLDNQSLIEQIIRFANIRIDVGGGIRSESQIERLLTAGVDAVNIGSIAVDKPALFFAWLKMFGAQRIWLSADVRQNFVSVNGWKNSTKVDVFELLREFIDKGLETAVVTAIERDGMLCGPDLLLYETLSNQFPDLSVVASGGVSSMTDVEQLMQMGVREVIVGKALYERGSLFNEFKI